MISILLPTRKRPANLRRLVTSIRETSVTNPEIVVYIDDDDKESIPAAEELKLEILVGPRIIMTDYWNKCFNVCSGDIVMQMGDDVVFKTHGWDRMVEQEFEKWPDKLIVVHGDDLDPNFRSRFGTHSCVHRKWVDTLGYFIPPFFSSDNGDRWLMAVADFLDRRIFLPFITEHMHFRTKKAPMDSTYTERLERHEIDNPNQLYIDMIDRRLEDAAKIQQAIDAYESCQIQEESNIHA